MAGAIVKVKLCERSRWSGYQRRVEGNRKSRKPCRGKLKSLRESAYERLCVMCRGNGALLVGGWYLSKLCWRKKALEGGRKPTATAPSTVFQRAQLLRMIFNGAFSTLLAGPGLCQRLPHLQFPPAGALCVLFRYDARLPLHQLLPRCGLNALDVAGVALSITHPSLHQPPPHPASLARYELTS